MNTTKKIRQQTGLTQKAFAEKFGIPIRTLQSWEAGERTPAEYIFKMIKNILEMEERGKEMNKEMKVEKLVKDGRTIEEASEWIEDGSVDVFEDIEEWWSSLNTESKQFLEGEFKTDADGIKSLAINGEFRGVHLVGDFVIDYDR